jgi:integrase
MKPLTAIPLVLPNGIKEYTDKDGNVSGYEADAGKDTDGKRLRPRFSFDKCGSRLNALNDAIIARESTMNLKAKERREAAIPIPLARRPEIALAMEILDPLGVSLVTAARYYEEHLNNHRVATEVTFRVAREQYIAFKRAEECDAKYLSNIETSLLAIGKDFDSRKMSAVTAADLQKWLAQREIGPVTWNAWRRDLRTFFNFALRDGHRWVNFNPAANIAFKKIDVEEVEILENKEVKELLKAAVAYNGGRQVPWLVLGLFGGLRRDEADAAQWEDVDFQNDTLKVRAAKARSAGNRYVHIEPVLKAWLENYKPENARGPIGTMRYARRNDLAELSEQTGLELNKNFYRHTYGSNHLWRPNGNKQHTMLMMGHTSVKTFDGYYNKPRPKMVALAYWDLTPESVLSV